MTFVSIGWGAAILAVVMIAWSVWEQARLDRRGADERSRNVQEFDERTRAEDYACNVKGA